MEKNRQNVRPEEIEWIKEGEAIIEH